jgi:uncharacterized protein (TIGR04255 family)
VSPLPNAPLAITAMEVRYPELEPGAEKTFRSVVREGVRDVLPLMENVSEDTVQISPTGPPVTRRLTFPRFVTRDRTTALAINPTVTVLETTDYNGFQAFTHLIAHSMTALEAAFTPDGITRVGLRYIDEIRVPSVKDLPGDWHGYIDEHLLATVAPDFLEKTGLEPQAWQGLVQYSTGPDQNLQLRYGPQDGYAVDPNGPTRRKRRVAPGPFFLLDSDSFWQPSEEVPPFSADFIVDLCKRLHEPLEHIFRVVSTDRLWKEVYENERAVNA